MLAAVQQTSVDAEDWKSSFLSLSEKVRREVDTLVGPVTLYRPYFYCSACCFGFYPLDEALNLPTGEHRRISKN